MTDITLTAQQIKAFDELGFDKQAVERTLTVALVYHSNRVNELRKTEIALWDEIAEIHGLDLKNHVYTLDYTRPFVRVVQTNKDE